MAENTGTQSAAFKALEVLTKRFPSVEVLKPGVIQFQLTGDEGGNFALEVDSSRRVKQIEGNSQQKPRILLTGDGRQVRMVLEGKRDAAKAFLAGGIQVRGDIHYLERLLQEVKLLKSHA